MYEHVSVYICGSTPWCPEEGLRLPGRGVAGGAVLSHVDAGN